MTFSTEKAGPIFGPLGYLDPEDQKTPVRIPPGYKVFRKIIAMLWLKTDFTCIFVC
jgi:hypothetical protein